MVLVEYIGDETAAKQFPHGNAKDRRNTPFIRTQPHVLHDIRTSHGSVSTVYRDMQLSAATTNQHMATAAPRNKIQIRNIRSTDRNRSRPSRDAIYNLMEFAYDSEFVHEIHVYPDLWVVMYHQDIINMFRSTLKPDSPLQLLSYDTTFNLGDFYLSVLIFRETEFEEKPMIPLAFLLHERKLTATHDAFFRCIASLCPEINSASNVVMVTDSEVAITKAISDNFPDLNTFLCWNHILQDAKRWLRSHGVTRADEMQFYIDSIQTLFQQQSEVEYTSKLVTCCTTICTMISYYA